MSDSVVAKALGGFFIFKGATKIIPLNAGLQARYATQFKDFATVFPLARFGLVPSGCAYKTVFGGAQVVCGAMLVAGSPSTQKAGCVGMLGLVALALQTLIRVGDTGPKLIVPVVIAGALAWLYVQIGNEQAAASSKPATKKA